MNKINVVDKLYELRNSFIILGLTGKTGSGCSTVAKFLTSESFANANPEKPISNPEGLTNDERKYKIVYEFAKKNWKSFVLIKASDVIFHFVLLDGYDKFIEGCVFENSSGKQNENQKDAKKKYNECFSSLKNDFIAFQNKAKEIDVFLSKRQSSELRYSNDTEKKTNTRKKAEGYISYFSSELPAFRTKIFSLYDKNFISLFQRWGNNIRKYGHAFHCSEDIDCKDGPISLAQKINEIVKMMRDLNQHQEKSSFIVIDSIRNPYEVLYFRERYSAFYLMSVTTDEETRRGNLHNNNFDKREIDALDKIEYPEKSKRLEESYFEQDIQKCIELSDIFVYTNGDKLERNAGLKKQLIKFISLIQRPGLISPSPQERLMQVAHTAKVNSGCISRQVGAAITDKNYSVKALGWNTAPQGQTPCSLCNFDDLCLYNDKSAYSDYEWTDEKFREELKEISCMYKKHDDDFRKKGIPFAFCFKDIYSRIGGKGDKVHTRSLHAEENAFLQLAKYGSMGIEGGMLFTTASPCELCSKKAYQLGVAKIYYIDIYPGISLSHILRNGEKRPSMLFFEGAIGRAYESLYNPIVILKDEIEYLTDVNPKETDEKLQGDIKKSEVGDGSAVDNEKS